MVVFVWVLKPKRGASLFLDATRSESALRAGTALGRAIPTLGPRCRAIAR